MSHRYKFENTLEYINLTGCVIAKATKQLDVVKLEFEQVGILPEHPFFHSSHTQVTDHTVLTFENCDISECLLFVKDSKQETHIKDVSSEEFFLAHLAQGFEIQNADSFLGEKKYSFQFFGKTSKENGSNYAAFSLSFDRMTACWNHLFNDEWLMK